MLVRTHNNIAVISVRKEFDSISKHCGGQHGKTPKRSDNDNEWNSNERKSCDSRFVLHTLKNCEPEFIGKWCFRCAAGDGIMNFDLLLCANCVVYDTYQWNADRRVLAEKKINHSKIGGTTKRSNRGNGEKQPVKLSRALVCVCHVCDKQRNITEIIEKGARCHRARHKNRRASAKGIYLHRREMMIFNLWRIRTFIVHVYVCNIVAHTHTHTLHFRSPPPSPPPPPLPRVLGKLIA